MNDSPLARDLARTRAGEVASFHMPGHKGGAGASPAARELLGESVWVADVSEMGGYDYLHAPQGAMAEAQGAASRLFGAGRSFFLVNGSTGGNLAAIMATTGDGDRLLMLRGSHRSVFTGCVLSGAVPIFVPQRFDPRLDGWFVGDPTAVDGTGLDGIRAVHVTRPNYYGMCCDLEPYVALARRLRVPLIVDEAHGAHFGLHPALPASALSLGADIVIQSTHKTLGALTQASMLHVRDAAAVDVDRIARTLAMLESSSPSALLTLSLDLARAHFATNPTAVMAGVLANADIARRGLSRVGGLHVYGNEMLASPGVAAFDPTKVVVDVTGLGLSGFAAAAILRDEHRIWVELADFRRVVLSVTVGDDARSIATLVNAATCLPRCDPQPPGASVGAFPPIPEMSVTPRAAAQLPWQAVAVADAAGRVSGEYLIPYPPGIPLVVPGERLDAGVLRAVDAFRAGGSKIVGPADRNCATLRCLTTSP